MRDVIPYLGSHLAFNTYIDSELQDRISAANCSFGKHRKRIYDSRDLSKETKLLAYTAFVLPVLLHNAETWTFHSRHITQLERFQQRCLRTILHIHWSDRRTNISVLESARLPSIETMIRKSQLRWAGHVVRKPDNRLPKQLLFGQLTHGVRPASGLQVCSGQTGLVSLGRQPV